MDIYLLIMVRKLLSTKYLCFLIDNEDDDDGLERLKRKAAGKF
jgi:hypothetical protein